MENQEERDWNTELEEEVSVTSPQDLVVFSRDWTVETIAKQIDRKNIDLNPKFQRRNAWSDDKRSKLIESLIIRVPVPEIVLAEDQSQKGKFIIIDGKQRLLAVAGFLAPDKIESWDSPKLRNLKTRADLNGKSFQDFGTDTQESAERRALLTSDIRCTIISNYKNPIVLYDIFYRLNAGSVPLSSQELRQVLRHGPFADYLMDETNKDLPLHEVMNLSEPDARLRDAEILLRYIAVEKRGSAYQGNLSTFLDDTMKKFNQEWTDLQSEITKVVEKFSAGTKLLIQTLGSEHVGRKYTGEKWETRFNRALFEVQAYYFSRLKPSELTAKGMRNFNTGFQKLCNSDTSFRSSIETTTKTNERYEIRFEAIRKLINKSFGTRFEDVPIRVVS